jgi:hypothetical protein
LVDPIDMLVQIELKFAKEMLDSQSGQRLQAGVDLQAGEKLRRLRDHVGGRGEDA